MQLPQKPFRKHTTNLLVLSIRDFAIDCGGDIQKNSMQFVIAVWFVGAYFRGYWWVLSKVFPLVEAPGVEFAAEIKVELAVRLDRKAYSV